ncbi:MAG: nascent polypeptide-associated complex protein [Thermoplasmatales archaeon]|nr:MAG: nascent polypeptide-associated complex protein [Thermoplasmatales archaeon]
MMPGLPGRMNQRQMNQMMRRLGINIKNIDNVEKVIIRTDSKEYVFDDAEVTIMEAQGQKTFQISGKPLVKDRGKDQLGEDIKLVVDQTGKSEEEARKALKETNGDIAEAILKLS